MNSSALTAAEKPVHGSIFVTSSETNTTKQAAVQFAIGQCSDNTVFCEKLITIKTKTCTILWSYLEGVQMEEALKPRKLLCDIIWWKHSSLTSLSAEHAAGKHIIQQQTTMAEEHESLSAGSYCLTLNNFVPSIRLFCKKLVW